MWLLSTDRAELHHFHDPTCVPGGYAILSHVWEGPEQTFRELQELRVKCAALEQIPRDLASPKVRESCCIAQRHGYKWIWNDTCCINKESNADLSEAINSMFRYYSLATICYAYLYDVPNKTRDGRLDAYSSPFRMSKWHRRGWTLQELIAPPFLVFLSKDWDILGTKVELAELLEEITKVPAEVLRFAYAVSDTSVASRMSWAAHRETTRFEDMAYCLMGIFSINMSTLYGEGQRAFLRLQEEILKQTPDASLFVWEDPDAGRENTHCRPTARSACEHFIPRYFLLAQSPKAFSSSTTISFDPSLIKGLQGTSETKTPARNRRKMESGHTYSFSITPDGIQAHVPVIQERDFLVAALCCFDEKRERTIGLLLTPCYSPFNSTLRRYHTAWRGVRWRTIMLGKSLNNICLFGQPISRSPQWMDIIIADRPPLQSALLHRPGLQIMSNYVLSPPFRLSMPDLGNSLGQSGSLIRSSETPTNWTGSPPLVLEFRHKVVRFIYVVLGWCTLPTHHDPSPSGSHHGSQSRSGAHWAVVSFSNTRRDHLGDPTPSHDKNHHIANWTNRSRLFTRNAGQWDHLLTLSFVPDGLSPGRTLVPHIKLEFRNQRGVIVTK